MMQLYCIKFCWHFEDSCQKILMKGTVVDTNQRYFCMVGNQGLSQDSEVLILTHIKIIDKLMWDPTIKCSVALYNTLRNGHDLKLEHT